MIEIMTNILRRFIGYPPFKYEIGEELVVDHIEWDYSIRPAAAKTTHKIHAKVHGRFSRKSWISVDFGEGYSFFDTRRVNVYNLAFRKKDLDRFTSLSKEKAEYDIQPYEQGKTKLGSLR